MKRKIISFVAIAALSVSSFNVFAEERNNAELSVEVTPELHQIQNGEQLALRAYIKNIGDTSGDISYELIFENEDGDVHYSTGSSVAINGGEETSFATTINKDMLTLGDKVVVRALDDTGLVLDESEVELSNNTNSFGLMSINAVDDELPVDDEMDAVWDKLSKVDSGNGDAAKVKKVSATSPALTGRTKMNYTDGYSEGLLKKEVMNFESQVTNHKTTSDYLIVYTALYTTSGTLYSVTSEPEVSVKKTHTASSTLNIANDFNSIGSVKYYTWNRSMEPWTDAATYTKSTHYDNFLVGSDLTKKGDFYPLITDKISNPTINGSLKTATDTDVIAYQSSKSGKVTITNLITSNSSIKIQAYNGKTALAMKDNTFNVNAGVMYYIKISGTKAENYKIKFSQPFNN